ncbi:MAG: hypothetical protein KJ622_01435 [Alphaproteobacteria bacterium]|nr:hypothetical protein [Alphaproteobacteria bacterium]
MASSDSTKRREPELSLGSAGFGRIGGGDWIEPEKEPRDWKKLFLVFGLGVLSWVATYVGMLELIESNMGDLPIIHKVIIGFSVAMLMTMIIWLLDQIFSPINFTTKVVYVFGYLFLTLISVGFGFGFYWKVLESRGEATRSAESAISQVQTSLHAGSIRIEQLSGTLAQLTEISNAKAVEEREKGTSCPNSKPGDGPRRKLRDADAQKFSFAGEFVRGRIDGIKSEVSALDAELAKVVDGAQSTVDPNSGNRNEFLRGLNRRLDMTVAGFNAFRGDPQLGQIRSDLAARAEQAVFPNGSGGTFACPDAQLQTALRGVVRAIDQLPVMQRPQVAAVEGSEATIEAFRRLAATLQGALVFELPPSADELRSLQKRAVQSATAGEKVQTASVYTEPAGLSKRDYIPLSIAVFVDFCLLLVSIGRPINRLNGLVPVMREAERGPMIKILSRFNDIHRDPEIRQNFEVFRHVVFDLHGAYYVAVPLDAPYRPNGRGGQPGFGYGSSDAQELQHEAHLLANLFSGFEQQKIFSRVYNPFLTTKAIQKKLWRQGSKFAGCQAFRVYRFRDGAWSDMILQAVMGAAKRAEEEKRIRAALDAERRANEPPASVDRASANGTRRQSDANAHDPLQGFDTGLKLAPDVEARRNLNGASYIHPAVLNGGNAATHRNGVQSNATERAASGTGTNGVARETNGYSVSASSKRRRARSEQQAAPSAHADDPALRSAFGRYAPSAAAEFSEPPIDDEATESTDGFEPIAVAANGNTAPAVPPLNRPESRPAATARFDADNTSAAVANSATDVVIALSDKRNNRVPASEVAFQGSASARQVATAAKLAHGEPHTTVTLLRETATFAVPSSDARLTSAIAAAQAIDPNAAATQRNAKQVTPAIAQVRDLTPPPLPDWALQSDEAVAPAPQAEAVIEIGEVNEINSPQTGLSVSADDRSAPDSDSRWQLASVPEGWEEDDDDDRTIVTIAQRLRPEGGKSEV